MAGNDELNHKTESIPSPRARFSLVSWNKNRLIIVDRTRYISDDHNKDSM